MRMFVVLFSVRKGLGPDWIPKKIEVGLDDIADLQEWEVIEAAKADAKQQLRNLGYCEQTYIYKDIENI
jgi:hypothetical protein